MYVPSDKPVVTPVCQEQEKIIEKTKFVERACPTLDDAKIEKAFLLFLASIGIKKDYSNDVKSLVSNPESYSSPMREEEVAEATPAGEIEIYYPKEIYAKVTAGNEAFRTATEYEPKLRSAAGFVLKDPALFVARSKLVDSIRRLRRLNGTYSGKFYRMKGRHSGAVEDVELRLNFWIKEKRQIDGTFNMTIARDGNIYSNARGEGSNNDIYINPSNDKQVIIKAAPGTYYHFQDMTLALANVYEEGQFIGVATLTKQ